MVRTLGEFKGRQDLYREQSPQVLETLRKSAMVESVESSNRIEGVTMEAKRLEPLVANKIKPKDRSEEEIAGYRDVLAEVHTNAKRLVISPRLILDFHRRLYAHTPHQGGSWPVSAVATPEQMEKLCALYRELMEDRQAEPLLAIGSLILDFESVHPFPDGNGRLGRLLTLLLLYQEDYEVGRYISLERIVEQSKETYWDALLKSSHGWHEGKHDLRPWWSYFLGTLIAAYKEFEQRVGAIKTAKGAKRALVQQAVERLPSRFRFNELQRACPGVSYPTLKRALMELKREKKVKCLGKGRDAEWMKRGI